MCKRPGKFAFKPATIKVANADYKIAAQHNDYQQVLTNNVKSAYYDFLCKKQLELLIRCKGYEQHIKECTNSVSECTVTLDVYTAAKSASEAADVSVLNAEADFKIKTLWYLIKKIEEAKWKQIYSNEFNLT